MNADEILRDIRRNKYECLICTNELSAKSKVWSCRTCYRVYDLHCIRGWAKRAEDQEWKCPHCLAPHPSRPSTYRCWCGKVKNPEVFRSRPHSCGQTCGAKLDCPHPCALICHPGQHQECTALGPRKSCYCGSVSTQTLCTETAYNGFSCHRPCGKMLSCKRHSCSSQCHQGRCSRCRVKEQSRCYCGKTTKEIECGRTRPEKNKQLSGAFACSQTCDHLYNCGIHRCNRECHPLSDPSSHKCPREPTSGETCPCGKATALELLGTARASCEDPLPCCDRVCTKELTCGHSCPLQCHDGECPPCTESERSSCACGSQTSLVPCLSQPPDCNTKCGVTLTCGRHKCQNVCCAGAQEGRARQRRVKQKFASLEDFLADASLDEMSDNELAVHMCTRTCGKMLSCGKHPCMYMCHKGPCRPCLQSSSDDWSCPCGQTTLRAPIRCGSSLPRCPKPCHREQTCGHAATHACHDDSTPCVPCNRLVQQPCLCGKESHTVLCGSNRVARCVSTCDKPLSCGHACSEVCHSGPCPPCNSKCLRDLACANGHKHQAPCHGEPSCGPCTMQMVARCPCRNLQALYECGEELEIFCNDSCFNKEPEYHPVLTTAFSNAPQWAYAVEAQLRDFIRSDRKVLWFKPMKKADRRFVHYLLEHYGVEGVSMDRSSNRSVRARRKDETWLPKHTIGRALELSRLHDGMMPVAYDDGTDFDST